MSDPKEATFTILDCVRWRETIRNTLALIVTFTVLGLAGSYALGSWVATRTGDLREQNAVLRTSLTALEQTLRDSREELHWQLLEIRQDVKTLLRKTPENSGN